MKNTSPAVVSLAEVCETLGRHEQTVRRLIQRNVIPGYQEGPGGQFIIPRPAFEAFMNGTWTAKPRQPEPQPIRSIELKRRSA